MTRRNSSISSSSHPSLEARRFLLLLVLLVLGWLGIVLGLSLWARQWGREDLSIVILRHQQTKIMENAVPPVVFLGDSSLGNALSIREWEKLGGPPAWNLALNGYYGYAGSYNLLRQLLARGKPQQVVLLHTVDMLQREPEDEAYWLSAPASEVSLWQRLRLGWLTHMHWENLLATIDFLKQNAHGAGSRRQAAEAAPIWVDDYIRQGPPKSFHAASLPPLEAKRIQSEKTHYLRKIRELCDRERLNCFYLHGPVTEAYCTNSRPYLTAVNQRLKDAGFPPLNPDPFCFPNAESGDSTDHVHPDSKAAYTARYWQLLKPYVP